MALVVVASFNTKAQTIFCQIERTVNSLGDLLSYRVSPPQIYFPTTKTIFCLFTSPVLKSAFPQRRYAQIPLKVFCFNIVWNCLPDEFNLWKMVS